MKNIFISSTFRDMQAERDMVQKDVVPVLREKADTKLAYKNARADASNIYV